MNVAITGEGIVSAIGLDKQQVMQALLARQTGIGEMKYLQSVHHELPVGEVKLSNDEMKQRLGIPAATVVSRTALMGMMAIGQALAEAGVTGTDGRRVVLVSGTTVGGMDITEQCFEQGDTEVAHFMQQHDCGSNTNLMAAHFGLFTDVTTLSTACSSAANAMMLGARLLKAGQADIVVAGGTEALSRFHLNGFHSLMILDHEPCRPFDATRAGLNLGEGAAFVVMESEASARSRGIEPHAFLTGYGNACDAFHQTASSADGEGAYRAMGDALRMAGLTAADIQYVNAHGTGTPNNDQSESEALRRIFGDQMPPVSSTKGFTGHTTSASGSIEAVVCLLAMRHGFIPANLGWQQPMDDGIVPTMGVAHGAQLHHVLCNSFGFGGNDSALILSDRPQSADADRAADCDAAPDEHADVRMVARVEITDESRLADISRYVKPLEARRMGKLMKASLLASLEALEKAGIEQPDAIITATTYGCLENSERLLLQIKAEGEGAVKPTYFMQSTHNTIGSSIAIKTRCHGYNVTYTQESHSLQWAMRDADLLLRTGRAKTVLVGIDDETTPLFNSLLVKAGLEPRPAVQAVAMVLSCGA